MKLKYLSAEFLLIFVLLLLPPLFIGPSSHVQAAPRFGWGSAETLAIAFFLYFQILKELERPPCPAFRALSISTVTLGCLMLSYSAVELAALASAKLLGNISPLAASREITGLARWISATAALAAGAFYEECLYRVFLPEIPMLMVCKAENSLISRHKKFFCAGIETLSLLIFAFSHRYLGWAAVANALMCGAILRQCYRRSARVLCGTAAHFCYNMTLLVFSSLS